MFSEHDISFHSISFDLDSMAATLAALRVYAMIC